MRSFAVARSDVVLNCSARHKRSFVICSGMYASGWAFPVEFDAINPAAGIRRPNNLAWEIHSLQKQSRVILIVQVNHHIKSHFDYK